MADEILNKLGFDVTQALTALQNLDARMQASQVSFQNHATQLGTWNAQAQAALATMRQLATAAAGMTLPALPTAAGPAASPTAAAQPSLWLPPGLQTQINQAAQSMTNLGTASTSAGQQMVQAGTQGANAAAAANTQTRGLMISWQMLTRIVITQMIVRALSTMRNMLRDVTSASIELQRSLAEIQAITPKIHGDFVSLGREAGELSKKFNIPLPQVTEGLYQSISNQFVSMSERARIMDASMRLARIGCMELDDAVLLLTGTLNAYGMNASNADIVAAKFFKTIQLGRIRGKELADTIGTVIPFAAQLGVSLDEVAASYVSMTIGGLEAHKTATGLRQVMVALLKPSEDLKKSLREMGFISPEQLVQAKGFQGALDAIAASSNNMGSEIVKSIRNVRALTAELSLTRDGSEQVAKAMAAMEQVTTENFEKLYEEFTKMPAEKLTKEINALKVSLTQDLGAALVQVLADMVQWFGGAEKISAAIQTLISVLAKAGAAVLAFAATWAVLHLSMGPIGWALLAIGAGLTYLVGASTYQSIRAIQDIKAVAQAARDSAMQRIKTEEDALRKIAEAEDKANRDSIKVWENKAAIIRRDFFKAMDELREKNTRLIEDTRTTLSAMVASQERVVSAYRNAAKATTDAIVQSRERQANAEAAYSDAVYKYAHKNEGAYQRAEAYMRRARQLAKEAQEAMGEAKTPEQIAAAQAAFQRAEAAANEAEQIAGSTKYILLQDDAQRTVLGVMRQKIEAEQALQEIQAREAQRLAAKAADEEARLGKMKTLMKAILTDLQAFDKAGAREPKQLEEQEKRLRANVEAFRREWVSGKKVDVADLMAFDQLQQRVNMAVEGGLTDVRIQEFFATPDSFAKLREDIEKGVGPVRVLLEASARLDPELQKALKGLTAEEGMALLSEEMGRSADAMKKFREVANAARIVRMAMEETATLAATRFGEWAQAFSPEEARFLGDKLLQLNFPEKFRERANALNTFMENALKFTKPDVKLDAAAYETLNKAFEEYLRTVKPSEESEAKLREFMTDAQMLASEASHAAEIEGIRQQTTMRAILGEQRMKDIKAGMEEALRAAEQAKQSVDQADQAAAGAYGKVSAVSTIDTSSLATQTQSAADAMWDLAYASMSVQTPAAPEMAARGGRVGRYLAAGGPVGTDVVPAWLSRGEFVMNAGSASRFASQLVAMNAGVQPTFRGDGGSVTNIGDINVSVSGGATGRQTARSIAAELRRELRRGTTTL